MTRPRLTSGEMRCNLARRCGRGRDQIRGQEATSEPYQMRGCGRWPQRCGVAEGGGAGQEGRGRGEARAQRRLAAAAGSEVAGAECGGGA